MKIGYVTPEAVPLQVLLYQESMSPFKFTIAYNRRTRSSLDYNRRLIFRRSCVCPVGERLLSRTRYFARGYAGNVRDPCVIATVQ